VVITSSRKYFPNPLSGLVGNGKLGVDKLPSIGYNESIWWEAIPAFPSVVVTVVMTLTSFHTRDPSRLESVLDHRRSDA